jgi:hypothetical protein
MNHYRDDLRPVTPHESDERSQTWESRLNRSPCMYRHSRAGEHVSMNRRGTPPGPRSVVAPLRRH